MRVREKVPPWKKEKKSPTHNQLDILGEAVLLARRRVPAAMQAALANLVMLIGEGAQGMLILVVLAAFLFLAAERMAEARAAERRAEAEAAERRAEAEARRAEAAERSAEAAARSAEAAARSAEAALCHINVRRWDGHTSAVVKLRLSFAHFRAEALGAVRVAGLARLYTVQGGGWQERQLLTDATYAALLRGIQSGGDVLVDVLVFQPLPGADASPDKAPVEGQEAPPGDALVARARKGDEASSGRSTAVQSEFRIAILRRDGKACVLCSSSSSLLEAAHVIPRTAEFPLLLSAGLMTANQPSNGIMLCVPCHRLYDAFMWCFDPTSGVVVADALLSDAALGEAWKARVGAQLSQPDDAAKALNWPPPSAWAASLVLFHAARDKRHAKADAAQFACSVCGKRWVLLKGLTRHSCLGAQASATYHTPSALRRQASGGGGGRGGGADNALVEESEDNDSGAAASEQ